MARQLILVRHGKAQARSEELFDQARALSRAGFRSLTAWLPRMANLVAESNPGDIAIWTSPAVRAIQTADLVSEALNARGVKHVGPVDMECLWSQDEDAFLDAVRDYPADTVIAAGHNPFMEDVSERLCGASIPFATGGVAAFRLADETADDAEDDEAAEGETAIAAPVPAARLLWFMQGPESKRWKLIGDFERIVAKGQRNVEERLATFFEAPEDVEATHKARIAIRTQRGILAFVKPFQQRSQNEKMSQNLRDLVIETSRLREYDVLIEEVAQLTPPADDLLAACQALRERECARTVKALTSKEARKKLESVNSATSSIAWKSSVEKGGFDFDAANMRFMQIVDEVENDLADLDISDVERTHDVRKAAKQVRYAAEKFKSLIGEDAPEIAAKMKDEQDRLGALCDARVNIDIIDAFPKKGLSEKARWDLSLLRARNEAFLYTALRESQLGDSPTLAD